MRTNLATETRRGRGNPNWIRGAQQRRAREASKQENKLVATIAPAAGAAIGALGITIGADKLGIPRQRAAIGAAAVGLVTAATTRGVVRGIALGVGAAGTAIAIAQQIEQKKQLATREELARALKDFVEARKAGRNAPPPGPEAPPIVEKLNAVAAELNDDECEQLREFIATAPEETLRTTQAFLLDTPTEESLRFLREHLLIGATS